MPYDPGWGLNDIVSEDLPWNPRRKICCGLRLPGPGVNVCERVTCPYELRDSVFEER